MNAKDSKNQKGFASIDCTRFDNKIKRTGIQNTTLVNNDMVDELRYQTTRKLLNKSFHINEEHIQNRS